MVHAMSNVALYVVLLQLCHVMAQPPGLEVWRQTAEFPRSIYLFSRRTCLAREHTQRCKGKRSSSWAVTILSYEENVAVYNMFPEYSDEEKQMDEIRYHWIGLYKYEKGLEVYKWRSLPPQMTNYTNWKAGDRPRPDTAHYFADMDFLDRGLWEIHDYPRRFRYICEDTNQCFEYCMNGGTCSIDPNTGNRNEICECPLGYIGRRCQAKSRTLPCDSNPCVNGATCMELEDGMSKIFRCSCTSGYRGTRCENDVDECALQANPCDQRGTNRCRNEFGDFECECLDGFKGDDCSQLKSDCSERPCEHGAICMDDGGRVRCQCPPFYTGAFCELGRYSCLSDLCLNGGTCLDIENGWRCVCSDGFSGDVCQTDVDECTELGYCSEFGCNNVQGSYSCRCPEGFKGPQCNTDINECATIVNPCYGRGDCTNVRGPAYTCTCRENYDPATRCAVRMKDCAPTGAPAAAAVADTVAQRSTAGVVAILVVIVAEVVIVVALGFVVLRWSTQVVTGYKTAQV